MKQTRFTGERGHYARSVRHVAEPLAAPTLKKYSRQNAASCDQNGRDPQ